MKEESKAPARWCECEKPDFRPRGMATCCKTCGGEELRIENSPRSSMYWAWAAFVDIHRDRLSEFQTYEDWIVSEDPECRAFRQGWAAMGAILRDPKRYPDPIDSETTQRRDQ